MSRERPGRVIVIDERTVCVEDVVTGCCTFYVDGVPWISGGPGATYGRGVWENGRMVFRQLFPRPDQVKEDAYG